MSALRSSVASFTSALTTLAITASLLSAGGASAQSPPADEIAQLRLELAAVKEQLAATCRVAIFDFDRLLAKSERGVALEKSLNELRVSWQAELKVMDEELQRLARRFQTEAERLSEDERRALGNEILEKRGALEKRAREADADLERRRSQGVQKIGEIVGEIAVKLAKERGLDVILERNLPLVASSRLDLTDELLKRLDARS